MFLTMSIDYHAASFILQYTMATRVLTDVDAMSGSMTAVDLALPYCAWQAEKRLILQMLSDMLYNYLPTQYIPFYWKEINPVLTLCEILFNFLSPQYRFFHYFLLGSLSVFKSSSSWSRKPSGHASKSILSSHIICIYFNSRYNVIHPVFHLFTECINLFILIQSKALWLFYLVPLSPTPSTWPAPRSSPFPPKWPAGPRSAWNVSASP